MKRLLCWLRGEHIFEFLVVKEKTVSMPMCIRCGKQGMRRDLLPPEALIASVRYLAELLVGPPEPRECTRRFELLGNAAVRVTYSCGVTYELSNMGPLPANHDALDARLPGKEHPHVPRKWIAELREPGESGP